ncbi:MAG: hypothetical protein ACREMF_07200 [Gemmatimonadales bacterium]
MTRSTNRPATPAALGIRVKSGWAVGVLLAGPATAPRAFDRQRIELADPRVPRTRQPYHAGFGVEQTSRQTIARLVRIVERCARRSVAALLRRYRSDGFALRGVGVVVGSVIDPARIANPHIRAHAAEGALFRRVVVDAARRGGLGASIVLEREVYRSTARAARKTERQAKAAMAEVGRGIHGRWRAEEKTAAAAAWLVLAQRYRPPSFR